MIKEKFLNLAKLGKLLIEAHLGKNVKLPTELVIETINPQYLFDSVATTLDNWIT
ncbi:hypothetical protein ABSA28_00459 [Candidatus Hepatincolaceae symbiont of Richtersius coronifer]